MKKRLRHGGRRANRGSLTAFERTGGFACEVPERNGRRLIVRRAASWDELRARGVEMFFGPKDLVKP